MAVKILAYKFRAKPTESQQVLLAKTYGCCRFLYNQYVEWNNNAYAEWVEGGKVKGTYPKMPLESTFKVDNTFLKDVDSTALMNTRRHFQQGMQNFVQSCTGKRKGKKVKPPKFKKKYKCKDSFTSNVVNGNIRLNGNMLRLPKLGEIELILHRPLPENARIMSVTMSREKDGSVYASIKFEADMTETPFRAMTKPIEEQKVIGLDMSLNEFYVSSEKEVHTRTKYVKNFRKAEKSIKRLNRQHSRKQLVGTGEYVFSKKWQKDVEKKEPSKNREKARQKLAKQYRKVANRRLDFCCQEAARLSKTNDAIVIEDIDLQAMSQALHLGKSINDLGFGIFKQRLTWACEKNGCLLVKADKWYASSKTCNDCGFVNKELQLSDREWVCPHCGCVHDRDFNAALNLRDWYYKHYNTAGTAGIYACGDCTSTLVASAVSEAGNSIGDDRSPSLYGGESSHTFVVSNKNRRIYYVKQRTSEH